MLRVKVWSGCCTSQAEGSLVDTFMSHPWHPNQADRVQFEPPQDPLWLGDLINVLRFRNSRLRLLAMKCFFFHTQKWFHLILNTWAYCEKKKQAGDGRLVWLTACGGLQCDRFVCLEAVLFLLVTWELSPLILSKSQRKWVAVQAVLKVNRPVTFPWFNFFFFSFWSQAGRCCCIK